MAPHHLLEQTTLILCIYLEVSLSLKQVLKVKVSKKTLYLQNPKYMLQLQRFIKAWLTKWKENYI